MAGIAAQGSEEAHDFIVDGMKDKEEEAGNEWYKSLTDEQLKRQAEQYGVTLEQFKAQIAKGWKPLARFSWS